MVQTYGVKHQIKANIHLNLFNFRRKAKQDETKTQTFVLLVTTKKVRCLFTTRRLQLRIVDACPLRSTVRGSSFSSSCLRLGMLSAGGVFSPSAIVRTIYTTVQRGKQQPCSSRARCFPSQVLRKGIAVSLQ